MKPRLLRADEIGAAVALLGRAGLAGGAANIGRYVRWQPDGAWGVEEDGQLIGMVTLLAQPPIGFVGCMAVEPSRQGAGLGRLLLEHAHAEGRRWGLTAFGLEATPVGAHLYRKLGYVTEHESIIFQRQGEVRAVAEGRACKLEAQHLDGALAIDREATGADRRTMIAGLIGEFPGITRPGGERESGESGERPQRDANDFAVSDARGSRQSGESGERPRAWGLVVGERLGPVLARDEGAGRAVIAELAPSANIAQVPGPNEAALAAVQAAGFTEARRLERMWLGPRPDARVRMQWTLASPGAG